MKTVKHILLSLVFVFVGAVCYVPQAFAEGKQENAGQVPHGANPAKFNKPVWGKKPHQRTGLYSVKNPNIANGVSLNVSALYYYGDVDQLDQAFVHGFQMQNLSFGGGLHFNYAHPMGRFFNWRFSLGAGFLHGNDSTRNKVTEKGELEILGKGKFHSIFGEAAAGLEFYPLPRAGFYIYAGLGINVSYINYEFYKYPAGNTVSVLPMLPLEIGYNFYLGSSCFLGISIGVHQGLLDMGNANLDAWPLQSTSVFQWGDGYFVAGISFAYRWRNCEVCRHSKW